MLRLWYQRSKGRAAEYDRHVPKSRENKVTGVDTTEI